MNSFCVSNILEVAGPPGWPDNQELGQADEIIDAYEARFLAACRSAGLTPHAGYPANKVFDRIRDPMVDDARRQMVDRQGNPSVVIR